jgi:O-antigen/teichoic acid export membrane protein
VLRGLNPPLAAIVFASIPLAVLFSFLIAFFTGAERFRERAGVGLVQAVVALVAFGVLAFLVGKNAESALVGNLLGLVCGAAVGLWMLRSSLGGRWTGPSFTKQVFVGLMAGMRGQAGNMAAFFNYRLDVFIVNYFLDAQHVGLYSVGVVVSEVLWQVPQAIATALFPRTARRLDEDSAEFTCLIMRQVFAISCMTALALALVSPIALPLFFGERFRPSVPVIWWILPGTIALSLAKVASSDLAGRYKTGYSSVFGFVAFCTTVVLDILLIPKMGINGAALASSVAYSLHGALLVLALKHEFRVGWKTLLIPGRDEWRHYGKILMQFTAVATK